MLPNLPKLSFCTDKYANHVNASLYAQKLNNRATLYHK